MGALLHRQPDEAEIRRAALRLSCPAIAATALATGAPACAAADNAGPHDFDFTFGTWNTHIKRLLHPPSGSPVTAEYDGTATVSTIWGGRANLFELVADGPAGHLEGLGPRLYNPQSHQWTLNWPSSADENSSAR